MWHYVALTKSQGIPKPASWPKKSWQSWWIEKGPHLKTGRLTNQCVEVMLMWWLGLVVWGGWKTRLLKRATSNVRTTMWNLEKHRRQVQASWLGIGPKKLCGYNAFAKNHSKGPPSSLCEGILWPMCPSNVQGWDQHTVTRLLHCLLLNLFLGFYYFLKILFFSQELIIKHETSRLGIWRC